MSTTTIRLPEELKARVARAAQRSGATTHSFILEAIAEKTEAQERRDAFFAEALRRKEDFDQAGLSVPWDEMRDYMVRLAKGENPPRPLARKEDR
jgi:predicted transcriptional regulator